MPPNMMQVYELTASEFNDVCDQYPDFRKFILVRSMVRRSYFKKAFDENIQEILIKRKKKENAKFCAATGKPNLFKLDLEDHDDEENEEEENSKKVPLKLKAKDNLSEEEVLLGKAI